MLTLSAVLFGLYGVLALGVGLAVPVLIRQTGPAGFGLFHPRPDEAVFGRPVIPPEIERPLRLNKIMLWDWLCGMLASFGILQLGLVFGFAAGAEWAYWTLVVGDLVLVPHWWLILARYREAGVMPRVLEAPPLLWLPAIAVPLAAITGWLALH